MAASYSPDGARIMTGSSDGIAKIWDARTGVELRTFRGHTSSVVSVALGRDGTRAVTGSLDGTAKVWDISRESQATTVPGLSSIESANLSREGTRILTTNRDGPAKVWDASSGAEIFTLGEPSDPIGSASFSPDGSRILTTSLQGPPIVWDAATGSQSRSFKWHIGKVVAASYSPDGSRIVTCGHDNTAILWDAKTGAVLRTLRRHTGSVLTASFSPDGTRLMTGSEDRTARVWDASTGEELLILPGHASAVLSAAFSPDGRRLITANFGSTGMGVTTTATVRMWDASTGTVLLSVEGGPALATSSGRMIRVFAGSFSPDGSRLLTAGPYKTARVWDAATGSALLVLTGHTGDVLSAYFSPDGSRIVTGGYDNIARIWDTATGAELLSLKGNSGPVHTVGFSSDGTRLLTSSGASTIIWDSSPFSPSGTYRGDPAEGPPPPRQSGPVAESRGAASGPAGIARPYGGLGAKPAGDRAVAAVRTPSSLAELLSGLRGAGRGVFADVLTRQIDEARGAVPSETRDEPQPNEHVIVGRVVGEGLVDASRVLSQMRIYNDGYFVDRVWATGRPIGFRKQGFLPLVLTPTGEPGAVEYVGDVRLRPVPETIRAGVKGRFVLEDATGASGARATLQIRPGPINRQWNLRDDLGNSDPLDIAVAQSGEFSASGLSPMASYIEFEAPGYVRQYLSLNLKPGETLDLGMIRLERPRQVAISYREAPHPPPFTQSPPGRQTFSGGGLFKASDTPGIADLNLVQSNRQFRFGSIVLGGFDLGPILIADLGPGKLDDFLRVAPASARFTSPEKVAPQPGHVYLLEQKAFTPSHWVLFQFELDPEDTK